LGGEEGLGGGDGNAVESPEVLSAGYACIQERWGIAGTELSVRT
jgi:hypothetical protein